MAAAGVSCRAFVVLRLEITRALSVASLTAPRKYQNEMTWCRRTISHRGLSTTSGAFAPTLSPILSKDSREYKDTKNSKDAKNSKNSRPIAPDSTTLPGVSGIALTLLCCGIPTPAFPIIRIHNVFDDLSHIIQCLPPLLVAGIVFTKLFNGSFNVGKARALLDRMKGHWIRFGSSPNIEILHKYGKRGRFITLSYTIYIYVSTSFYLILPVLPALLDIFIPLNESRPKKALFEAEYGVDTNDYFYEILFHSYVTTVSGMTMVVAVDSTFFMIVEHACGLFEMVGTNIRTISQSVNCFVTADHEKICRCIDMHKEALKFAYLIESTYSFSFMLVIGLSLVTMSISMVQIVLNMGTLDDMVRYGIFVMAQICHIFFNSVPGQRMINFSQQVHDCAYECNWVEFDTRNKRLVLIIMMRSQKPSFLSAGKVYILSMENYSSVMRTAASYFTVLTSMI